MADPYVSTLVQQMMQRWHESPLTKGGSGGQTRPMSDPFHQLPFHLTSLNNQSRVVTGVVVDVAPRGHCYKVAIENGRSFVIANMLIGTTCSEIGARSIGMLQPSTRVQVLLHPQMNHGLIIGAEPPYSSAVGGLLSGFVSQATRTFVDSAWFQPFMLSVNQVVDWTAGRPLDGIPGYEQGWMGATGTKITIDDFLVQMAVNEHCGVFGFYHDSLLRVAGLGLQIWAAAAEQEWLNDSGEAYEYKGSTPYVWEQSGNLIPGGETVTVRSSQEFLVDQPEYAKWEPTSDISKPFHRTQQFGGYLGQGLHEFVTLPPEDATTYEYGDGEPLQGVYEKMVGLDGHVGIRSAKGITLSKRLLIPVPRQLARPEDPNGDTSENYKFAGISGDGDEPKITGDVKAEDDNPSLQRAAAVLDLHAHLFNYRGLHPFHFHKKDWKVPDEADMGVSNQKLPNFGSLADKMYLDSPEPVQKTVDQRYGQQNYYQTESALSLLDDGAIVLYDGFGAEIKMVAGSLFLSTPGDIWLKSGRNIHLWAGGSVDVRAKDSIDIVTSEKDIRLKSERNLMSLSGNGGTGGTLIESRGAGSSYEFGNIGNPEFGGIVLRATEGGLTTWSQTTYIRSTSGSITIDANQGLAPLVCNSQAEVHTVSSAIQFMYGQNSQITAVDEFTPNAKVLSGQLLTSGGAVIDGQLVINGNIYVVGGHIATEKAKSSQYMVAPLEGNSLDEVVTTIADLETQINTDLPQQATELYARVFTDVLYVAPFAGADETIQKSQFTFREEQDYKTEDFKLYEDRWQRLARIGGVSLVKWQEPAVESAIGATYPFPGKTAFEGDTFLQQDVVFIDGQTGNAINRDDEKYTEPTLEKATAVSLKSYPVII